MQYESGSKMAPFKSLIAMAALFSAIAHAQVVDLSSGAEVEFEAVGKPSMINIKGTGAKANGKLELKEGSAAGEFILDLNSFTTDMDMRDEHMKEKYLETSKSGFDKAILKISQQDLLEKVVPLKGMWNPKNLKGLLTLHGVTKEVPLKCELNLDGTNAKGIVSFKIKLQDYAIEIPSFAGITVADEVTAQVKINHKVVR